MKGGSSPPITVKKVRDIKFKMSVQSLYTRSINSRPTGSIGIIPFVIPLSNTLAKHSKICSFYLFHIKKSDFSE